MSARGRCDHLDPDPLAAPEDPVEGAFTDRPAALVLACLAAAVPVALALVAVWLAARVVRR